MAVGVVEQVRQGEVGWQRAMPEERHAQQQLDQISRMRKGVKVMRRAKSIAVGSQQVPSTARQRAQRCRVAVGNGARRAMGRQGREMCRAGGGVDATAPQMRLPVQ